MCPLRQAAGLKIIALADTQQITLSAVERILAEYDAEKAGTQAPG